ncbi:Calponin domain protein [Spraguea lophii 42_110]|uniref:Calponin domain protein n=1 Tax=Spraguea lophii (strain 42_110) TaxID=1358809 RepID=S7W8U7_SPRLO|nr:Calponin domain protein [Spraguea lophii 42_110]
MPMASANERKRNVHERLEYGICSAEEMDIERKNQAAYDYLCRVEEAKQWISSKIDVDLTNCDFDDALSKGIVLAQLMKKFVPSSVKKIFYDEYKQYRHTDNHNFFIDGAEKLGLPRIFYFGVLDCYEKKNIPNVVYCLHALAHYMSRVGFSDDIKGLSGKISFSDGLIEKTKEEFKQKGIKMPEFGKIKDVISKQSDMGEDLATTIKQKIAYEEVKIDEENQITMTDTENEVEKIGSEQQNETMKTGENNEIMETEEEKIDIDEEKEMAVSVIKEKVKSFLYEKAFNDICYKKDATVFSLRKFLFIFTDNAEEIKKDLEIEELHKKILSKIKENYLQEVYIDGIECSVSLLLNNKVTIAKLTKIKPCDQEEMSMFPNDTEEFKKFQEIFYHLQTNPKYLSKLLLGMDSRIQENFIIEKVVPLFANSDSKREEYMILKLVESIMDSEIHIDEGVSLKDTLSCKIILSYFRENPDKRLIDMFIPLFNMLSSEIQCNPTLINKQMLGKEADRLKALENPVVKQEYINRLRRVKAATIELLDIVENNIEHFPYYIRFYLSLLLEKFPERREEVNKLFFSEIISPFLLAPHIFGSKSNLYDNVSDKSSILFIFFKRVLSTSSEILDFYMPLTKFSKSAYNRYIDVLERIANLSDYFQIQKEHFRVNKPVVQFTSKAANEILIVLKSNLDNIADKHDYFYDLVLNSKNLQEQDKYLISFYLTSNYTEEKDYNEQRTLKEMVVLLLSITSGKSLLDLLLKSSTIQENRLFERIQEYNEVNNIRSAISNSSIKVKESLKNKLNKIIDNTINEDSMNDNPQEFLSEIAVDESKQSECYNLPLDKFKEEIFSLIENMEIATKENQYNEILNMLAQDIVTLKILSCQRSRELEINKQTLHNLEKKSLYLEEKTQMYEEYIKSYAEKMTVKKRPSIFTTTVKAPGQESKYGTYKLKLRKLTEENIILKITENITTDKMSFYLSCDIPNEFILTPCLNKRILKDPMTFKLDVLLRMKYKKIETIEYTDIGIFSIEGLISLINSKYIIE